MFCANRFLCATRTISHRFHRCLPRAATSLPQSSVENTFDNTAIKPVKAPPTVVFNDYHVIQTPSTKKVVSKPLPKSVPKLIDVQTGLNQFLVDCDERMLLMTIESKHKLFDSTTVATFIQRLHELNIKRDSIERQHQRLYDFVDYFILKHGQQLDFDHVSTIFFQLTSLNGTAKLDSHSGSYALKGLLQLLKHYVNKYHLEITGRILINLEKDLGCNVREDERIRPLFDALLLLTKFRQNELDRLDARCLSELAYAFASELDHVYFTNILTEYIRDEFHHDVYSTMFIFRALSRRNYRHNRTIDIALHYVQENKDLFTTNEREEIEQYLKKLDYQINDE